MHSTYVLGVGMTPFTRHPDLSVKSLTAIAVNEALADAALPAQVIKAAVFANCVQGYMDGQHMVRGEMGLQHAGLSGIPMLNVENACSSGSSAFYIACQLVNAGAVDVALAVGAEKMYSEDKVKTFG